ncbi:hypothetical protein CVIRNUC_000084 [Coccomyxa viridis]|uniref:Uncharacterized protein n=1 Tax=Coccomyxa viridis TaxID=1274662 RepID=A0AAV1HTT5_9CHLO|nr:hypothetical protein CVIRNUC_000084 [Coccomyxa viridis]
MAGRKPAKPEIPETPFGALGSSPGEGSGQRLGTSRLNSRESDRPSRQPPIYEDQEQRQQPREKLPQYFSSIDSDRQRGSQLGSKESLARTPEFPSKATTRASSAGSRCPFLPCHGCVEHCLDTKDAQQHYRPSWASMAINLFLLLAIVVLSLAPLAGYQGGWAHFELDNINSSIMVQLGLAPWSHSIDVGYNKFTNSVRAYFSAHGWQVNGKHYTEYAKLWDNVRYGNEAQLLGGYSAGWLLLSAVMALAYLGLWLRCAVLLQRLTKGERRMLDDPSETEAPHSLDQWTIRPLGAWLWPVALVQAVVLAALLTAFLIIAQASNEYQCVHVAPGIDCTVQPGWAIWCAYGACFAWLALALMAMIEASKQRPASLNHPNYRAPSVVHSHGTSRSGVRV